MEKLNLDKKTLSKFGMTMAIALLVICCLLFIRNKPIVAMYALVALCLFFIMGFVAPISLKPIYICWMYIAFILGWINTRIILVVLFYLIFTPLGLTMKLFKIDLLEIKKKEKTYWKKKEKVDFNPLNYERRF